MFALAVAVGLSSLAIGAILSTALLIGPAATALRLTRRMSSRAAARGRDRRRRHLARDPARLRQLLLGSGPPGLPVSFFIVAVIFVAYLLSGLPGRASHGSPAPRCPPPAARRQPRPGTARPGQARHSEEEPRVRELHDQHLGRRHDRRRRSPASSGSSSCCAARRSPRTPSPRAPSPAPPAPTLLGSAPCSAWRVFSLLGALGDRRRSAAAAATTSSPPSRWS